jgi:hemerythrin-like metal-binding protein
MKKRPSVSDLKPLFPQACWNGWMPGYRLPEYQQGGAMHRPLFIIWQNTNEIGIPLLDEQHKGIVSIINTFYYMMQKKVDHQLLYSCITNTMKEYSKIHFITEESFMDMAKYDDFENHKKLHEKLTVQIDIIERKCLMENDVLPLLDFLL